MNIDEIYLWCNFLANKKESGAISPDEFNLAAKVVNLELLKLKVGLPEKYQVNAPYAPQMWQISQKISDDIRFLLTPKTISKVGDYFPIPNDYFAFSSLMFRYSYNTDCGAEFKLVPIEVVTDSEFSDRAYNALLNPTMKKPIANFVGCGLNVMPLGINEVELNYLRVPATPFRAYTIDGNDDSVYNAGGSTDFEYPESLHPDICIMICEYMGINIREEQLAAFMRSKKINGQ